MSIQLLEWNSPNNIGNIRVSSISTLNLSANIIDPTLWPTGYGAKAFSTLKLIDVTIVSGGANFSNGNTFIIPGGLCYANANATLTVTNVNALSNNSITSISISPSIQEYTILPQTKNVIWQNDDGINAEFNLSFGIDNIQIEDGGMYFDSAEVGFESSGETYPAIANASIQNGVITQINTSNTGYNYPAPPIVKIIGRPIPMAPTRIDYSIVSGSLPTGLQLKSNGLITGILSGQNSNAAYSFVAQANVASIGNIQNTFTINTIHNNTPAPRTNLSLEFLLSEEDRNTLLAPLSLSSIVPNSAIFRNNDFYFGRQKNVRMLMAYGLYPVLDSNIVSAITKYHQRKRFSFSTLSWAQSTTDGYEVIYIQPQDEYTDDKGNTYSGSILLNKTNEITVDLDILTADSYYLDASNTQYTELYPATIPNMIQQLKNTLGDSDDNYLPSWMTDIQSDGSIIGFIPAIPLLYCNPNNAKQICYFLQQYYNKNSKLQSIKAETDRYIWNEGLLKNWNVTGNVWTGGTDTFLHEDEGSVYFPFKNSFLPQPPIGI